MRGQDRNGATPHHAQDKREDNDGYRVTADGRYRYRENASGEVYWLLFVPVWLTLATALTQHIFYFPSGDAGFGFAYLVLVPLYALIDFPRGLLALLPLGLVFTVVALVMIGIYRVARAGGWLRRAQQGLLAIDLIAWGHMYWPVFWRFVA